MYKLALPWWRMMQCFELIFHYFCNDIWQTNNDISKSTNCSEIHLRHICNAARFAEKSCNKFFKSIPWINNFCQSGVIWKHPNSRLLFCSQFIRRFIDRFCHTLRCCAHVLKHWNWIYLDIYVIISLERPFQLEINCWESIRNILFQFF